MLLWQGFWLSCSLIIAGFFVRNGSSQFLWGRIPTTETPSLPQDCVKRWGRCQYVGPSPSSPFGPYFQEESVVVPAKNGGSCSLNSRRFCDALCNIPPPCSVEKRDCVKRWSQCYGSGPNSYRFEIQVEPAENGGTCELGYEYGCNERQPVDCTKRWGECIGNGPSSVRTEIIVTPAKHGGKCELKRETGCRYEPVDCVKKWGECVGIWEQSSRTEVVVEEEKYGGSCELRTENECNTPPRDCRKRWGKCVGEGPKSSQKEIVVEKEKYGGVCELETKYGCNLKPVDCKKRWGRCTGSGPTSIRREIIVTPAKHGGKCQLRTERGCNPNPVDCVKKWGPCTRTGSGTERREIIVTPAKHGGKCQLRTETGCKVEEDKDEDVEESPGKKIASLLLSNFVVDSVEGSPKQRRPTGARSLRNFGLSLQLDGADEVPKTAKNCTEFKAGDKVIAVGCDDADDIDPNIIAEEDRRKIRGGEKQRNRGSSRERRSTEVGKAVTPRDILFLLDSSGSIGPYRFETLKEVCKAMVDVLCGRISLGKYQTRIALATFNARQLLSFPFSKTSNEVAVKRQIDAVKFDYVYSYQSCIKDALQFVLTDIYLEKNGARDPEFAEGDMFIMTDGCANCDYSENNKELQRMAYRLKLNKINVYAIGIGIDENCRNILKVLARGGRCFHFFYLDDWDVDVRDFLHEIQNPRDNRCLDQWEFSGIDCLDDRRN